MTLVDVKAAPASIGTICVADWKEEVKSNTIQTESENGSVNVRRRFTGRWRTAQVSVNYKAELYEDFMNFFHVICRDGIDAFWIKTPYKTEEAWRWASVPEITWIGNAAEAFRVNMTLVRNDLGWPKR